MGSIGHVGTCLMHVILPLFCTVLEGAGHTLHDRDDATRGLMRREASLLSDSGDDAKRPQYATLPLSDMLTEQLGGSQILVLADEPTEGSFFTMPGVPNKNARNLGAARGSKTRLDLYTQWTRAHIGRNPDQLAIFVDGYNVVSGGCDDIELRERYEALVKEGGPGCQLVVGAQFSGLARLFDNSDAEDNSISRLFEATIAPQRYAVLTANNLTERVYSDILNCDGPHQKAGVACEKNLPYGLIDLGFVMGPIAQIHDFFMGIKEHKKPSASQQKLLNSKIGTQATQLSDEEAAALYVVIKKTTVMLDYTGGLVMDLRKVRKHDFLTVEGGTLFNNFTKTKQCFVHGEGHGWAELLAAELHG